MVGNSKSYNEMKSIEYRTDEMSGAMKAKGPIARFKAGAIQVAVWENDGKDGKQFKTISLDKRYKAGDDWKSTKSFGINDLPKAILALQKAFEFVSLKEDAFGQAE